jgi:uncharacterized protein
VGHPFCLKTILREDAVWLDLPRPSGRQLFVAFKIAEVCNLACKYCYFFEQNDKSFETAPPYITNDLVTASAKFLGKGAFDTGIQTVSIALHGGEPLMLGKTRMLEIINILKEQIEPYANLRLGVQTNGVLLDREWVELLTANNCSIGLSLDGPKEVHDATRIDKRGRGTYDSVVSALSLLKQCQSDGVISSFGVISVIDPKMTAAEAYDFFVSELNLKRVYFRPPNINWDSDDSTTVDHIKDFLQEIFSIWLEKDDPTVDVRSNVEVLRPFLHDDAVISRVAHIVDLAQAISIRSNGDVCPDDSLPPLSTRYRDLGFNVQSHSLVDFYNAAVWPEIQAAILNPSPECRQCRWFGMCGGGPIVTRYSSDSLFTKPSVYCDAFKSLYTMAFDYAGRSFDDTELHDRVHLAKSILTTLKVSEWSYT